MFFKNSYPTGYDKSKLEQEGLSSKQINILNLLVYFIVLL